MPHSATLRVALHGHFYYTDHVGDFMRALAANVQRCELILTTNSPEKAAEIRAALSESRAEADIRVLPQHLIGDEMPMVDIIKRAFIEDPKLGLVFPEDPFLVGWDENLEIAQKMAGRMRLRAPLPASIESPVGTMFWTRPETLAPLLRLGLTWDDYPHEPPPIDGTMLHALERLLPLIAEDGGYYYATTYFPRFVR
jgi:lipopolysaccharide biosynthesis protein